LTPRIIFWCGKALEPWAPPSLNRGGIGGSETAVIHIARRFAEAGWRVDVYNTPDYLEGEYDGVGYWGPERLRPGESCDVLVSWRQPAAIDLPVSARMRLLWLHDLNAGPDAGPQMRRFDRVCGVSQWHADYLRDQYDLDPARVGYVPNGIDLERFDPTIQKVPFRCVWSASPDRDLDLMLDLWPIITATEPAAELHVAYGWQGFDFRIARGDGAAAELKAKLQRKMAATRGVVWHDRLGQDALARLKCESWMSPYPTAFLEVSCISMMESMAAGAVPVTSAAGALKETVGDGGYVVTGPGGSVHPPHSRGWQGFFVQVARGVLCEMNARKMAELRGRERAKQFTWDKAMEKWQSVIAECLEPQKETVTV
jgi:glycosyltransferase involved in cell wall biosynthesis